MWGDAVILASLLNSYPRIGDRPAEQALRRALQRADRGELAVADVARAEDEMIGLAIAEQSAADMDLLTDGQVRWHDPVSHLARGLAGFRIEGLLRYFDTNTYYRQPVATGPIGHERPVLVQEYRFAAAAAAPRPVKAVLTGPLTIARLSRDARGRSLRDLALQVGSALNREVLDLEAAGAALIQVDEPALAKFPGDADTLLLALRRLVSGTTTSRILLAVSYGDPTPLLSVLATMPAALFGLDIVAALGGSGGDPVALGGRLAETFAADTGFALGVIDGRNTRLEDAGEIYERRVRPILSVLRRPEGGPVRVIHLVTNHGLEFLPRDTARAKMSILAAVRDRARQEFP